MKRPKKAGGYDPHSKPDQNSGRAQKQEITGGIFVRGEIETYLPESEVSKREAANQNHQTRENSRYLFERLTFFAVVIYAGLTAIQACETREAIVVARKANDLTEESVRARVIDTNQRFHNSVAVGNIPGIDVDLKNIGRSEAVYGLGTDSKNWVHMPATDMPIAEPNTNTPIEAGGDPVTATVYGQIPYTKEFLEGLPTLVDQEQTTPKLSTYFFLKLRDETLGRKHGIDFCVYVVRIDDPIAKRGGVYPTPGDDSHVLHTCPKWNQSY